MKSHQYGVALRYLMGARVHVCDGTVSYDCWTILNDKFDEVLAEARMKIEASEFPLIHWNSLMVQACHPFPIHGRYL